MKRLLLVVLILPIFLTLTSAASYAQSGDVVVSANTSWPEGAYGLTSLTVNNGATLTIGGGSTVTVSGSVTVTGNATIVFAGKNTTGQVMGQWVGVGVSMQAANLQIDVGSQISADGRGYVTGQGPGGTAEYGYGASYGGRGSGNSPATYGSYLTPTDLGSGGGAGIGGSWSAGGGAIRLIVSGTLTNNGTITADGTSSGNYTSGASGGSIYVTAGVVAGSGTFTASGNQGTHASSGGGRVAIYYTANGGFNPNLVSASGGNSSATPGTVYLLENNANLYVTTNLYVPADTSASYTNVTVSNGGLLTLGGGSTVTASGTVLVTGSSTILVQSKNNTAQIGGVWQGAGGTINAGNVQVDAGSQISADGQGYFTGQGPGGTSDYGYGASYGGRGSGTGAPAPYGSYLTPTDLGSGGGVSLSAWSAGGGAIRLIVSGSLTNNGTITADGMGGGGSYRAGASGGSIYVTAGTVAGTGTYTADGNQGYSSSGGGGRVAVYYTTNGGFNPALITANPGGVFGATAGSVYALENNANLYVSANLSLPPDTAASYANLTVSNGASLTLGGGSNIAVSGTVLVTGNSTVLVQSKNNTAQIGGVWQGAGGTINAGNLQVDAGSQISADGQGYVTGMGPGGTDPSDYSIGASYGGRGSGASANRYGSYLAPTDLGSAGGVNLSAWSTGGGAIRLIVSGTLTNNGTITADGMSGGGSYRAGASGGSIYVTAGTVAGTGTYTADGNRGYSSSGGGGRIAIYYGSNAGFEPSLATATPGMPSPGNATAGSVLFVDSTANNVRLPGGIVVLDPYSTATFHDVSLEGDAAVMLGGSATLHADGTLSLAGGTQIVVQSTDNAAQVEGQWIGRGATIVAGNLNVASGGRITADGQGYVTATGPGASSSYAIGGSHGGRGSGASAATYGSAASPIDLGSGGNGELGGYSLGGGAIRLIVSGTLSNDGIISANGMSGGSSYAAGAAGGSVYVTTGIIAGSGSFTANGSVGSHSYGGGGRVAIYYKDGTFASASITANGGGGTATAGSVTFTQVPFDVTIDTSPSGLVVSVDGSPYSAPRTFQWLAGSSHTIATTSPQAGAAGTRYLFSAWSDGGGMSHTVTASLSSTAYTASFNTQYQLTTAANPVDGGTVTPASGGFYYANAIVDVVAAPAAGRSFDHWTGPVANVNAPSTTVTMTAPTTVTAHFTLNNVQVTVATTPAGRSFTVDGTPYTSAQTFSWQVGSNHTIATTSPQAGGAGTRYVFASWSDAGVISHQVATPASPTTYTATFTTQYLLTTAASPANGGTIAANPTSGDGYYGAGVGVQLTATATTGYTFANWSGGLTGATNPQTVTMSAPRSVTANFTALIGMTVTTNPPGRTFTVDGTPYTSAQTFNWTPGSNHTIATTSPQAGPGTRYVFGAWSDGGAISHAVTAPASPTTYTATFATQYLLTTAASPVNGGTVTASPTSGDGYYTSGVAVQLTATANTGYTFANWSGDLAGTANPQTVSMGAPRSVTAHFALPVPPPTVSAILPASGALAGGTVVTVTGAGFLPGATVTLGSVPATGVTVASSTSITATTGAHAAGVVSVVVRNPDGQSGTLTDGFTYRLGPTVTAISPVSGLAGGGTTVTITGTGFLAGATVAIGGVPASSPLVGGDTSMTVVTAAHAPGVATVVVTNPDGQSGSLPNAFTFFARAQMDVDGDRRSDMVVWRPSTGGWWRLLSNGGFTGYAAIEWGAGTAGDVPVPGDYDGDGKADCAFWRPSAGTWWVLFSGSGQTTYLAREWGSQAAGDVPVPGDYDGDGKTDLAFWRPSAGAWWVLLSGHNYTTYLTRFWGSKATGDTPMPGDYDGDGKTDFAFYRTSTGTWWVLLSSTNYTTSMARTWGAPEAGDAPIPADYDGDGKIDFAVYRPSAGTWWALLSGSNYTSYLARAWGLQAAGDTPVPGDYDGDGKADLAFWRPGAGTWWVLLSGNGLTTYLAKEWGSQAAGDVPVREVERREVR